MPESEIDLKVAEKEREELLKNRHTSLSGMISKANAGTSKSEIDDVEMSRYLYGPHSTYTTETIEDMADYRED